MLFLRPHHLALLFLLQCLFLALVPANALPVVRADSSGATTVMTKSTTSTPAGDMTQTCVISLTPITDANGNPAVEEVKTCTVTMSSVNNGSSNSDSGSSGGSSSSTTSSADSSTTSSADSSSSTDTANSGSSSTDTGSGSSASSTATAGGGAGAIANGVSTVPVSGASATSAASGAATTGSSGGGGAVANGISTVSVASGVQTSAGSSTPTAAEANAASPSTSAAFAVPGQKLQVLPIGLGVFAGISVIALIVVGLVTYERTKYRKAFRARKLAEAGAPMGYSGTNMGQR